MGLRFRKSFKLAPGLRLNMSGSGFSWSVGPLGASINLGRRNIRRNLDLPGSFSFQSQSNHSPRQARSEATSDESLMDAHIAVSEDGTLRFTDAEGTPLVSHLEARVKDQQGAAIKELLVNGCKEFTEKMESLESLHLATPPPHANPSYVPETFLEDVPVFPMMKELSLWGRLFPWVKRRLARHNDAQVSEYHDRMRMWKKMKAAHEAKEQKKRDLVQVKLLSDAEAMRGFLEQRLQSIQWPRETTVAIEVWNDHQSVAIDVDLPEIEDLPRRTATYNGRGWKLIIKELSETKHAQLYMRHVHSIGFRMIGEAFAALASIQTVTLSGYSQRLNAATGQINDEYVYSIRVSRQQWTSINFNNLQAIDVVEAFDQFDVRRNMLKSGRFNAIEPFGG